MAGTQALIMPRAKPKGMDVVIPSRKPNSILRRSTADRMGECEGHYDTNKIGNSTTQMAPSQAAGNRDRATHMTPLEFTNGVKNITRQTPKQVIWEPWKPWEPWKRGHK